jgi:non-homologous end joining protein Ku
MQDDAIERRLNQLRETAKKYASAFAQKEYIDEFKKSKLSLLMQKYERKGITTAAGQEREARSDIEYLELLDGYKSAIEESERLRWELKLAEVAIDIWRTKESSKRLERKGYGL